MAAKPLMRPAVKGMEGWTTSDHAGIGNKYLAGQTQKLAMDAGFEQKITLCAFRRGAGNAVNSAFCMRPQYLQLPRC